MTSSRLAGVTRLEVHSSDTRLVRYVVSNVEAHLQDDGRTLKIFFTEGDPQEASEMQAKLWTGAISDVSTTRGEE